MDNHRDNGPAINAKLAHGVVEGARAIGVSHSALLGMDSDRDNGPAINAKLAYGVVEAARAIGVSRSTLYELMKQGRLRFVKCGRRRLILAEDLMALLQSLR
jgi:excisionase family DNA binding protein